MKFLRAERGQAVFIMVFVLVGLLAMLGLAIDGGTVFLERRRMQNAADAASLAGTRRLAEAICAGDTDDVVLDDAVLTEIINYAEANGVENTDVVRASYVKFENDAVVQFSPPVLVGGGTVPQGASGVAVTTTITRPTYFLGLVGQPTGAAGGSATAVTGPPFIVGGLRPFGIPLDVIQQLSEGDCFEISFGQHCDDQHQDCTIEYLDGQTSSHRGWMNMNYVWNQGEDPDWPRAVHQNPSGGLQTWMQSGWDGTLYADCLWSDGCRWGDFIHAKPGTEQDALNVAPIGELIYVPVFDAFPNCDGENPDLEWPWPTPPKAPKDACTGMQGADYYHIVGFAGVTVEDMHTSSHSLELCVEDIVIGEGQPSPNTGYGSDVCEMHTMVVTLWR